MDLKLLSLSIKVFEFEFPLSLSLHHIISSTTATGEYFSPLLSFKSLM